MKPLEKAISLIGLRAIADDCEVSTQAVCNWVTRGTPAEHCPRIEAATDGAVTCEELRPDVKWSVLRRERANV